MCGICGFAGRADDRLIRAMNDTMAHRGPDGDGVRSFESVDGRMPASLGHRRLSILDPTPRGAQPMATPDQRYWITYNGEIYNFRELRAELAAEGVRFKTECDTEVLLALFERDGAGMLERINGIYTFAIWDSERAELFLARDRLGVKPLYYALEDGVFYFASEAKALLEVVPARMNEAAVPKYLTFLWVPDPETMFEGIRTLPAGHYARFARGALEIAEHWDMSFAPDGGSEDEWVPAVRDCVSASVRRQMVSDVPLGGFLSGGVDSSAIVAEMAAAAGKVSTFTIGFTREDLGYDIAPDDIRYSREVAKQFDIDYHERIMEADVVDLLPKLIWHMDEPVAEGAAISTYLICEAARERLTVILSGMGGDEIFAGYPRHLAARLSRISDRLPLALRTTLGELEPRLTVGGPGRLRGPRRNLKKYLRGIHRPFIERYLTHLSYYTAPELDGLLAPELRALARAHDPYEVHRQHLERVRDEHWLNQMLYLDLKTFLPNLNLTYTDKMSMAASAEVRVPLLDDELVAMSGRIPPSLKLHGTKRKYVFKRSQEGVLSRDVIWRPKAGFSAPLRGWLVGPLREMVDDLLSPDTIRSRGLYEPKEVRQLIDANLSGQEDNAFRLWTLLTLELWQRTFIDGAGATA